MTWLTQTMLYDSLAFVSFVVPTYRRPDVLPETLEALLQQDYPATHYEVIVVDDGSGDATANVVGGFGERTPSVRYYWQNNSGVARARNEGARRARGDVLIFVDDDIVVGPALIRQHLKVLDLFGRCLVNGHWEFAPALAAELQTTPFGRFRIGVEQWVKAGLGKQPLGGPYVEPEGVTACNLAVVASDFWEIGGFDEAFPYAGCEDQEFSLRARQAGFRFVYQTDMQIWHNDGRLTLRQFCERQRRGAITQALLAAKHAAKADHPVIVENGPLRAGEPARRKVKKLVKRFAATAPAIVLLNGLIATIERLRPSSSILRRLYWAMCGLYIFQGVREGIRRYGSPNLPGGMGKKEAETHAPG